jgi:hypothetical protein
MSLTAITISNAEIQNAIKGIKNLSPVAQKAISEEVKRTAYAIDRRAKQTLGSGAYPYTKGHLKQSIHTYFSSANPFGVFVPKMGAVVGTNKEYASSVEFGARSHDIRPRNKKALRWGGPNYIFAKLVRHPGNRPKPYLFPAAEAEAPKFFENSKEILRKL